MKYKCVNHLDRFWVRDAQMEKCEYQENRMTWVLSGAAARYNNPENETLTDRYMDTAQVRFLDVKIRRCFLEGAKYYDADGVLQREVPDTEIPAEDYEKTFRLFADGVMFWVKEKEAAFGGAHCCEAAVDVTDPETGGTDTYWLELEYGKAVTEWEHFLNKAMLE